MLQHGRNPQRRSAFHVFADPPPLLRRGQGEAHAVAALQEMSANKVAFKLSPNSQIRAEKENFDPIRKQLVRYQRTSSNSSSKKAPLDEASAACQRDKTAVAVVPKTPKQRGHTRGRICVGNEGGDKGINRPSVTPTNRVVSKRTAAAGNRGKQQQRHLKSPTATEIGRLNQRGRDTHTTEVNDLVLLLDGLTVGFPPSTKQSSSSSSSSRRRPNLFSPRRVQETVLVTEDSQNPLLRFELPPPPPPPVSASKSASTRVGGNKGIECVNRRKPARPTTTPHTHASSVQNEESRTQTKHCRHHQPLRKSGPNNKKHEVPVILTPPELKQGIR
ncbi:hypothetical protein GQ54DRAFT_624 [Martensiomyces pterosporus]|nr:hypothetical protein GQ54DRAFT_624 [Martensiomyces pterosporus]